MATIEMIMPQMGEGIMEGTILTWLKKEGDTIMEDESVLEVATDKVDTEVPALQTGVLKKILAKEGDVIQVGNAIALIEVEGGENGSEGSLESQKDLALEIQSTPALSEKTSSRATAPVLKKERGGRFYSPLVKSIAKEEGIVKDELDAIPGTGKEGRLTKKDLIQYLEGRDNRTKSYAGLDVAIRGEDEIVEMDRMRSMIAERMLESKKTSAHVTSFVEADVTNIVLWRNRIKEAYQIKQGEAITFTPIFVQAIAKAIKDFPMINVSVSGNKIIKKKDINVGIAVALPSGNLIVPVIKAADQYSLVGLSKKVNDLATRARGNRLSAEELSGGTYTLSNVGSFGNLMGTPIIVQPQVAILAVGTIVKKPAVIETPTGDVIGIRHRMFLSHSYDHRVVDGALGGMFVRRVADYLEEFDMDTQI